MIVSVVKRESVDGGEKSGFVATLQVVANSDDFVDDSNFKQVHFCS